METKKNKKIQYAGIASSSATIISMHNVCHTLCMGIIGFLAVFGIAIAGMPLLFLTEYNIYFWFIALTTFAIMVILVLKNYGCVSKKTMVFNFGLLAAGFPFAVAPISEFLFSGGGLTALAAVVWFLYDKLKIYNYINIKNRNSDQAASSAQKNLQLLRGRVSIV